MTLGSPQPITKPKPMPGFPGNNPYTSPIVGYPGTNPGGSDPNNNLPANNPIYAPQRTTLQDSYKSLQESGLLPQYKELNYTPVSGLGSTLGDDYFNSIEQQATKKLQDRYFGGPNSLQNQLTHTMNQRGLIGSGIEVGGINELYKTFGDDLVDMQSNLTQRRLETDKELAFKNKEIEMENTRRALEAQQKNREFESFLAELGLRAAADDAKTATDFDTGMFEQQVKLRDSDRGFIDNLMGELNAALGNENIDKTTRQTIEDLFMSNIWEYLGPSSGSSYQDYITTQPQPKPKLEETYSGLK